MNKIIKRNEEMLTFYNYKEPLKEIPEGLGFGYYGVLLGTTDGEKVECHICGKTYSGLNAHIIQSHNMLTKEYKEKFDLAASTALISDAERERRKVRTMQWWAGLSKRERIEHKRIRMEATAKYKEDHPQPNFKIRLETKNKRGTCPDQLLAKIQECAKALGRVPTKNDFIDYTGSQRFVHLIYATFGSFVKARELAKIHTGNLPSNKGGRKKHTDDELLEYLQIFQQENNKIPTETDCRRGLIPGSETYRRHFGSLPKARALAGIEEVPTRWGVK